MLPQLKRAYWKSRERFRDVLNSNFVDFPRKCNVRGLHIQVNCSNALEDFRAGTYQSKEPETLEWLDRYLAPEAVFFDVGANIGLYSMYAALRETRAKVFSFEAEATNFSRLLRNIVSNRLSDRITPYCLAISDETKLDFLHLSRVEAGAALHNFGEGSGTLRQGTFSASLDDLVFIHGLPAPTILKVDVDNIEAKIFAGTRRLLSTKALKSILTEINFSDPSNRSIDENLRQHGFTLDKKIAVEPSGKIFNCIYGKNHV